MGIVHDWPQTESPTFSVVANMNRDCARIDCRQHWGPSPDSWFHDLPVGTSLLACFPGPCQQHAHVGESWRVWSEGVPSHWEARTTQAIHQSLSVPTKDFTGPEQKIVKESVQGKVTRTAPSIQKAVCFYITHCDLRPYICFHLERKFLRSTVSTYFILEVDRHSDRSKVWG